MVSRRTVLRAAAGAIGGLAGCAERQGPTTPVSTATDAPTTDRPTTEPPGSTTTTGAPPEPVAWEPAWTLDPPEERVLGLDPAADRLVAILADGDGASAIAAVDPAGRDFAWRVDLEGEPVPGSHADFRPIARDGVGTTVTDARVFAVTSGADAYDWSAIRAVARSGGEREWSHRVDRRLAVHGVAEGTVFATGREYFEPESTHDTPEEPLESVLYALDADTGEVRWTETFAGVADVAVGPSGVYVASVAGLAALGLDGSRRWTVGGDAEGRAVRAVEGRVYYLAAVDHDRSVVHGLTPGGERDWERRLPVHEVLLDGDRLYAGGEDTLALDPDGTVAWRDRGAYGQWLLLSPVGETLYTRAGKGQDRARAYRAADGRVRWTYRPPGLSSNNAWPVAATADAAVVEGITAEHGDDPFTTLYAVREGETAKTLATEPVFDVEGFGDAVFLAGESIHALEP